MASETEYLGLKLLGTSLQDKETYFEEWRQMINGEIDDSNMNIIDAAYKELSDAINDLKYEPIAIKTFSITPQSAEKGSTVYSVTLNYTLNKVPATLRLGSDSLTPAASGTRTLSPVTITENTSWTLTATDDGSASVNPQTASKNVTLSFLNKVYWGAANDPGTIDSEFLLHLSGNALASAKAKTFNVNAASGQYIWYAVPASMGTVTFKVGGFDGGFEPAIRFAFTNASGHTENFDVYRSTNASLGQTTVVAS